MARTIAIVREDHQIVDRSGEKNGKPWRIREQECFVELPNGERKLMRASLRNDQPQHAPGEYYLDESQVGFIRDQRGYDNLGYKRIVLVPKAK